MKLTISVIFATICLAAGAVVESSNIFERNFKSLHQEPPPPLTKTRAQVKTSWIDQKLDNFDAKETRTWQMRYMSNDEFFVPGGPIFIFVGGEWAISSGYITGGHMYDMAKEHKGALYYTEHRFYGESKPTSDLRTENLKYLDVKQALADLANFITTIKKTVNGMENSKVILTGGSYSATMVTWFKRLYPNLIVGAWSSSAPLLAKVDFVEYKEVTGQSIKLVGGEACYKRIQNGIAELEKMMSNKRSAEVKAMLKICNNFNEKNELDVWTLFSEISDLFAGVVQTHSKNDIQNACKSIMEGEDDVTGVAKYVLRNFGTSGCSDVSYKALVTSLSESSYTSGMMRQWYYQTCNEYGWYQTSGSSAQPFGSKFPVDLYVAACNDVYQITNETIHQNVDKSNKDFGGLNPNVENVYITHGQLDPWSSMGITDSNKATVIPLYAHCKDFGSISSSDSSEMRASKQNIANLVREWLK
ncbi:putative serine protease K12H4.7 [Episyrphus balteatus]|uniref:putative serine protease K12H4.7 n=1 Tax=Episyrphus balteatus TaxID=286459 RepID=UPI00248653ED|nr:putative serine protease K12H4.7 [Episyrphus balteatus]